MIIMVTLDRGKLHLEIPRVHLTLGGEYALTLADVCFRIKKKTKKILKISSLK